MKKLKLESLSLDKFKQKEITVSFAESIQGGCSGAKCSKCTRCDSCEGGHKDDSDTGGSCTPDKPVIAYA